MPCGSRRYCQLPPASAKRVPLGTDCLLSGCWDRQLPRICNPRFSPVGAGSDMNPARNVGLADGCCRVSSERNHRVSEDDWAVPAMKPASLIGATCFPAGYFVSNRSRLIFEVRLSKWHGMDPCLVCAISNSVFHRHNSNYQCDMSWRRPSIVNLVSSEDLGIVCICV